jgi:hypothetical protein
MDNMVVSLANVRRGGVFRISLSVIDGAAWKVWLQSERVTIRNHVEEGVGG